MLNKGFKEQIYDIYRYLPPETQVRAGGGGVGVVLCCLGVQPGALLPGAAPLAPVRGAQRDGVLCNGLGGGEGVVEGRPAAGEPPHLGLAASPSAGQRSPRQPSPLTVPRPPSHLYSSPLATLKPAAPPRPPTHPPCRSCWCRPRCPTRCWR